jgi:hypothetical protein
MRERATSPIKSNLIAYFALFQAPVEEPPPSPVVAEAFAEWVGADAADDLRDYEEPPGWLLRSNRKPTARAIYSQSCATG